MEISPGQCRAARALLNWTQETLANKVGVALKTIRDFENERRTSLKIVRSSIQQAFEQAGVEFFDDDGLRLEEEIGSCGRAPRRQLGAMLLTQIADQPLETQHGHTGPLAAVGQWQPCGDNSGRWDAAPRFVGWSQRRPLIVRPP